MIGGDDSAALGDARGLLAAFVAGGWTSAVVRIGELEVALGRDGGLDGLLGATLLDAAPAEPASAPVTQCQTLTAPHVGTLVEIAAVGAWVAKGERMAVLSVLDETSDVPAPVDGRVVRHAAAPGALVQFGEPIAEFTV